MLYMAPELFLRTKNEVEGIWEDRMQAQKKVDIYALGITYYFAMQLNTPFEHFE